MQTPLINSLLLGAISLAAFLVIAYWWASTKGTWKDWPAGRSLMGLLAIIAVGFANGTVNALIGVQGYPGKPFIGFALYVGFFASIIIIGFTVRKELSVGRAKAKHPASADCIDITVGTETEKAEAHD